MLYNAAPSEEQSFNYKEYKTEFFHSKLLFGKSILTHIDTSSHSRYGAPMKINTSIKITGIILTFAMLPTIVQATDIEMPGKLTKINADYRCEQSGGGVSFKIGRGPAEPSRIWLSDINQEMGLELHVVSFKQTQKNIMFVGTLGNDLVVTGITRLDNTHRMVLDTKIEDPTSHESIRKQFYCVKSRHL